MTAAPDPQPALILRLEGPLMAFGDIQIDQHGRTRRLPGLSLITGLLANALGWRHADAGRLDRLQDRLQIAALLVDEGQDLHDYQTVDLGQRHLVDTGWTTRGRREDRAGAASTARGTHIRFRHHRADAAVLVAVRLDPPGEAPSLDDLAAALDTPARPLFIGRKPCLPSAPLLLGRAEAGRLVDALRQGFALLAAEGERAQALHLRARRVPHPPDDGTGLRLAAEWPAAEGPAAPGPDGPDTPLDRIERLVDRRDWRNQFHGGERLVRTGRIAVPTEAPQ
jgi:CRISPR system Cascade subunit CasD